MQILLFNMCSLTNLILLLVLKPYKSKTLNYVEVLNEAIVLLMSDLYLCFDEIISDPEVEELMGWVFIGVIGLAALVNILIQLKNLWWVLKYRIFYRVFGKAILEE